MAGGRLAGCAGAKLKVGSPSRLIDKCLGPVLGCLAHPAEHSQPADRASARLALRYVPTKPGGEKIFSPPTLTKKNWRRTTTSYTVDQPPALRIDDSHKPPCEIPSIVSLHPAAHNQIDTHNV